MADENYHSTGDQPEGTGNQRGQILPWCFADAVAGENHSAVHQPGEDNQHGKIIEIIVCCFPQILWPQKNTIHHETVDQLGDMGNHRGEIVLRCFTDATATTK